MVKEHTNNYPLSRYTHLAVGCRGRTACSNNDRNYNPGSDVFRYKWWCTILCSYFRLFLCNDTVGAGRWGVKLPDYMLWPLSITLSLLQRVTVRGLIYLCPCEGYGKTRYGSSTTVWSLKDTFPAMLSSLFSILLGLYCNLITPLLPSIWNSYVICEILLVSVSKKACSYFWVLMVWYWVCSLTSKIHANYIPILNWIAQNKQILLCELCTHTHTHLH